MPIKKNTKKIAAFVFVAVFAFFGFSGPVFALPAFPGAEGMGASTIGGRGGTVYIVDTLSDNPADGMTFREAVAASGPRIVTFSVSGVINLQNTLSITNPNITISGQTSPGGVCTAGYPVIVHTYDVIITHMRFRTGTHGLGQTDPESVHAFEVRGNPSGTDIAYNIIIDHCSFSYGIDENVDVAYEVKNTTFSWCLVGRPLRDAGHSETSHDMNFLVWGKANADEQSVSIHHTFFGTAEHRSPEVGYYAFVDQRNNVAYNLNGGYVPFAGSYYDNNYNLRNEYCRVNWVSNYYKRGPLSNNQSYNASYASELAPQQMIYVSGNLGGSNVLRDEASDPEWCVGTSWRYISFPTDWQKSTPHETTDIPVTTTAMDSEYASYIVANSGATKPNRDSVDAEIALEYETDAGMHTFGADIVYPESWPTYPDIAAPTDTDNDGMSDVWETANSLNVGTNDSAGHDLDDNYTNVEVYLHDLGGYTEAFGIDETAPASPSGLSIN